MITPNNTIVFEEILAGVLAAMILSPLAILLARRLGFIDPPGIQAHKRHTSPMPLAGGIVLVSSLLIFIPVFGLWKIPGFAAIAVPSLVVFAFGLLDDHNKKFPAQLKLLGQVLAAVLFLSLGEMVQILKPGFLGLHADLVFWLNGVITILWLVAITNAFNFIDSMDGLATGVGATALAFLILATINANQLLLAQFVGLLFGIFMGLYFYNSPPARLFIGDSGAMTIGFLLAAVCIFYTPFEIQQASSWFVPILIMGIPLFDTGLVVYSRLRRHKKFYRADRDHTYHRLVKLGLDSNRAVLLIVIAALVLDCLAIVALSQPPLIANLIFGACLLAGVGFILFLDSAYVMGSTKNAVKLASASGIKD
jgi:UDP-GlcNAc:undecaprenyl-phosphate/decaprenyl-phosphate GlcNAc-1-phosphate transferase